MTMSSSKAKEVVLKGKDCVLPGFELTEASSKWDDPFYFIQAADTQLGLIVNYGDGTIGDQYPNVTWDQEIELCKQSVEILNRLEPKPKFFIVCGDIVDAFPDKWPEIREKQVKDFMDIYSKLDPDIPLVCVCGNHDIGNTPTKENVHTYRSTFGDDYFAFWIKGVHFIVINSQYYEDPKFVQDYADKHDKWIIDKLTESKANNAKHTIVFQHIPWFTNNPDEEKAYFNIEKQIREKMLKRFHEAGVSKIFCGHYHRNGGGFYKDMEVVVTTAIGCQIGPDSHGMRVVKVGESDIMHEFHPLSSFPTKIEL